MKSQFLALLFVLLFNADSLAFLWRPVATIRSDCLLPKANGMCFGDFPRYYFDLDSRQCKVFSYGGCFGNKNNFKTMQDCEAKCTCFLPKVTGDCRAYFPRYYFNYTTETCERFIYGGCQGNSNNFKTIAECYKTCPYPVV